MADGGVGRRGGEETRVRIDTCILIHICIYVYVYIYYINTYKCTSSYSGFRGLAQPHIGGVAGAITLYKHKHM